MSSPFAKAIAMMAAIAAAMRLSGLDKQLALDAVGTCRSRGKGRGTPSRNFMKPYTTWWRGKGTGFQERARRERQMANGQLREHPRAVQLVQHRKAA